MEEDAIVYVSVVVTIISDYNERLDDGTLCLVKMVCVNYKLFCFGE
jgi:hypothetical protein